MQAVDTAFRDIAVKIKSDKESYKMTVREWNDYCLRDDEKEHIGKYQVCKASGRLWRSHALRDCEKGATETHELSIVPKDWLDYDIGYIEWRVWCSAPDAYRIDDDYYDGDNYLRYIGDGYHMPKKEYNEHRDRDYECFCDDDIEVLIVIRRKHR